MTDKEIRHFFSNVMNRLGYYDWTLRLREGHDSYCWSQHKRIDIGRDYYGDIRQIVLHEIAHIGTDRFCNSAHTADFWKRLEYLLWKFVGQPLDEMQTTHKNWTSHFDGYYRVVYDRQNEKEHK